jgi:hypothetical protein
MYILGIDKSKINNGFLRFNIALSTLGFERCTTTTSAFEVLNEVQSNLQSGFSFQLIVPLYLLFY